MINTTSTITVNTTTVKASTTPTEYFEQDSGPVDFGTAVNTYVPRNPATVAPNVSVLPNVTRTPGNLTSNTSQNITPVSTAVNGTHVNATVTTVDTLNSTGVRTTTRTTVPTPEQTPNLSNQSGASYPIDSDVFTTLKRIVLPISVPATSPKILPYDIANYSQNGYGLWEFGDGLGYQKRMDLMSPAYNNSSVTSAAKLLNFFTMSDIHITDKESTTQLIYWGYKGGIISAYSPIMLSTTQVLDAAVQTINALNEKDRFDFGISLGDDINNDQYNELRWFIDVFDGKMINPDSGAKDDPIPGPLNDYQDQYKAAGLNATIPWYQALGNHDHFWMGINPVTSYLNQTYTGENILKMGNVLLPNGTNQRDFYMGVLDGRTQNGDVIGEGPVNSTNATKVTADPNRRSLSRSEWIGEFFNTTSSPKGHGFNQTDIATGFACYSFEPKSDIPIKVIVLDDTQGENETDDGGGYGRGSLDEKRYNWLVSELDQGQAEGKLMIVAAHIPIGVTSEGVLGDFMGWTSSSVVTDDELIAKLHTYPNLILWIAGHRHFNTVTALKSPDPDHPELGFWEVETSSLRDFPQQFRTFEINRNSDNTISIFTTDVDPAVKDGSLAAKSRSYAIASQEIFNFTPDYLPSGSYNAELVKQLSTDMQEKIKNSGTPIST
jgi:metallophosphoesterase (TIGR03768 family)